MSRRNALAFLAATLPLLSAAPTTVGEAGAAELRELPEARAVHCVSDDGRFAFGRTSLGPARWVRQADGTFVVQALDAAGEFIANLTSGFLESTAVDCSSDGSIALIDSASNLATNTSGVWKWVAASGWHLVQAEAGDVLEGSAMSGDAATVAWTREVNLTGPTNQLDSTGGLIDFFPLPPSLGRLLVREVSDNGLVAVGAVPNGDTTEAAVWRYADGTWTRVPPDPDVAFGREAIDVSDDGAHQLVTNCRLLSGGVFSENLGTARGGFWHCRCDAINGDGSVVVSTCEDYPEQVLVRWRRGSGWEDVLSIDNLPVSLVLTDLTPDGRYAVGNTGSAAYWADLDALPTACADGEDDDGDGSIDLADAGCASAADTSERDESVDCDDGWDDDGDGVRDYPMDVGCAGSRDPTETEPLFACDDGIDNDDDGYRDYPSDPGCPIPEARPENPPCDDRSDNDDDGRVDMADPDCSPSWPYWESPPDFASCGLGAEIALAFSFLAAIHRRALRTWRSTPDE